MEPTPDPKPQDTKPEDNKSEDTTIKQADNKEENSRPVGHGRAFKQEEDLEEDKKNKTSIICRMCGSGILNPSKASFVDDVEFKVDPNRPAEKNFWHLSDMFQFENVSFSRQTTATEKPVRFLSCADCVGEVIGFQYLDKLEDIYVFRDKVHYEPNKSLKNTTEEKK